MLRAAPRRLLYWILGAMLIFVAAIFGAARLVPHSAGGELAFVLQCIPFFLVIMPALWILASDRGGK